MSARCEICGKGRASGSNVSHSNRHTKRVFAVNLQKTKVTINGESRQIRACTRCLRTLSKAQS